MQMYDVKRKFQDAVVNSGLEYTIVCCGCFYETWFTPFFSFDPFRRKACAPAHASTLRMHRPAPHAFHVLPAWLVGQ